MGDDNDLIVFWVMRPKDKGHEFNKIHKKMDRSCANSNTISQINQTWVTYALGDDNDLIVFWVMMSKVNGHEFNEIHKNRLFCQYLKHCFNFKLGPYIGVTLQEMVFFDK